MASFDPLSLDADSIIAEARERSGLTSFGDESFIGSGTILVGPAKVGNRSRTGAGAVLTGGRSVPDGETWIGVPARPHNPRSPRS